MDLPDHMRIHEGGIHGGLDAPRTFFVSTTPSSTHTPPPRAPSVINSTTTITTEAETFTDTAVFSCPHCSPSSAGSATCESVAHRLANQCLEHQHTSDASAPTALSAPAHLPTAWA
ncbi:hypothetical protein SprV_0602194600 [Sparganum proliferum]